MTRHQFVNQNDWRIQQLQYRGLDSETLDEILDKALERSTDRCISVLEPGLSGFVVLMVSYKQDGHPHRVLLKINGLMDETQADMIIAGEDRARERLLLQRCRTEVFIPYASSVKVHRELGLWLCLVFQFVEDRQTAREFFKCSIKSPDFNLTVAGDCIRNILDVYAQGPWNVGPVQTTPWRGTEQGIVPLEQSRHHGDYLANIYRVVSGRPDLATSIEILDSDVRSLLGFLECNQFHTSFLDGTLERVPVAQVHGDFHGANILVSREGGADPVFIDFGQMSMRPDRHALYDIGKLSVDFEKSVLPSEVFDRDRRMVLQAWVDAHNQWVRQADSDNRGHILFERLYGMLSVFRDFAVAYCGRHGVDADAARRQFQFVRLHHILRIVNHPDMDEVRKLFAIRAAVDILWYLRGRPRKETFGAPHGRVGCPFDCTSGEFIQHLARADDATIVGITNQNLAEYIEQAWTIRQALRKQPWKELRVVFLARHLLKDVIAPDTPKSAQPDLVTQWENGVSSVRQCLLYGAHKKATSVSIRHADTLPPFVGQVYDNNHVRVAYLLHKTGLRHSCYTNFWTEQSPCMWFYRCAPRSALTSDAPKCCRRRASDTEPCGTCEDITRSPAATIKGAMECVVSSSTPLFAANVFGFIDDQNQFNYLGLMPQNNWREFSFDQTLIRECQLPAQDSVPAHLLVFIVPRSNDRTKLYLQRRTPENASGELDLFGVIPGKVNNEDFFPDPPKKADVGWLKKHREEIYRLQMAYSDSMTERQKWNTTEEVADRFADRVGITVGQPINDKVLDHACRRAAIRTIREKLGITVPDSRLERLKEPAQVNRPGQHDLFIIVFGLDLSVLDWDTICRRRPHSELKPHTRKQFEHLRDTKGLTEFLMTYFEHVSDYVYETVLVSKCLLGHICQYDGRPPRRTLTPELIERLGFKVLPVCPEESGGLPTPRERVEITGGDGSNVIAGKARVRTQSGQDLTENLIAGAEKVLHLAQHRGVRQMIVRRRSPSCSAGQIPDGTFSHRLVEGVGVTVAMLRSKTDVQVVEFERLVADRFRETMRSILRRQGSHLDWRDDVSQAVQRIREELPLGDASGWREIFSDTFRELLPELHHQSAGRDTPEATDSDTVRFFQDVFRAAWGWELLDPNRRCRICTYPEGFLDTYLAQDSTCSACRTYLENRSLLEDKSRLRALLAIKLSEVRGKHVYDAVVACSGGKDSTYMMMRLKTEYNLNLLAVMDDLNQQNEPAVNNVKTAAGRLGVELRILPPPPREREIRRNFMREGNTFCRLCLRSHFVRVYEVARNERIPLVCFGLSPYQCLDCTDAIDWSLKAIDDVRTPFRELDYRSLLMRYKHRAFQGGFDAGFIDPREKELYREWETVYDLDKTEFAPIIVPFFLFDGYPTEDQIMKTIADEVGWKKPEVLLNRTNCRLLRLAGMMHYAVGRYHLNYKERATRLRLDGKLLSEKEAATLGAQMDTPEKKELMGREEFEEAIRAEMNLSIEELPPIVRERLDKLFALYRKS